MPQNHKYIAIFLLVLIIAPPAVVWLADGLIAGFSYFFAHVHLLGGSHG